MLIKKPNQLYDVIIIGAGISGLVCGCYLAKAGMKVLVIEQHNKPGGYFTSFKRRGFLFDAAAHSFGNYRKGGHVRKILTEIGIDRKINIHRFDPSDIVITPDFTVCYWNNMQKTIRGLSKIFPDEKSNIERYFNFLTSSNQSEFSALKSRVFRDLLRSFFKDEKLISALAFPVFGNGGLPPSAIHAFSGSKIFSEFIIDGGYYPNGGIQELPNALDSIIRENNGAIVYRKRVKRILIKNNSAFGVLLHNQEKALSKYVVSACDMTQTFRNFLRAKSAGKETIAKLKTLVPSLSTFILYIGIDRLFPGLPNGGVNLWYLPDYDLDKIYNNVLHCNFSKAGFLMRVSPDQRTILAFVNAPFKTKQYWKKHKKMVRDEFLSRIEPLMPGLHKHIEYVDAATPSTLYRFTSNYQGAAFGWSKSLSQTFDPLFTKTTSIKGLYLTGHWTSIAFGMPGTCYSGHDTARRILRKEKMLGSSHKTT